MDPLRKLSRPQAFVARVEWILLVIVILAASVKAYSLYSTTLDVRALQPDMVLRGRSPAPTQYRLLFPLLWQITTSVGVPAGNADKAVIFASILFCYISLGVSAAALRRDVTVAAIVVLLFFGASASSFWF